LLRKRGKKTEEIFRHRPKRKMLEGGKLKRRRLSFGKNVKDGRASTAGLGGKPAGLKDQATGEGRGVYGREGKLKSSSLSSGIGGAPSMGRGRNGWAEGELEGSRGKKWKGKPRKKITSRSKKRDVVA